MTKINLCHPLFIFFMKNRLSKSKDKIRQLTESKKKIVAAKFTETGENYKIICDGTGKRLRHLLEVRPGSVENPTIPRVEIPRKHTRFFENK